MGNAGGQTRITGTSYHGLPNKQMPCGTSVEPNYMLAIADAGKAIRLHRAQPPAICEVAATNGKQVPWSHSSLLGEVYLAER